VALERIQKILSSAGICSRREAESLIIEGRVKVNGHVVSELGTKADPDEDVIKVGNKVVRSAAPKVYLLLNKPRGCVTTVSDPQGRTTVIELLGKTGRRVYPVGRLDYDTEGLLLLTNDGEFANAVMHPSREVPKTYQVKVSGVLTDSDLRRLAAGIRLKEGVTGAAKVRKMKLTDANSWIEMTIHEGWYRQVRRMCEMVGHPVLKIKRTKVGPLDLKGLPLGSFRELVPSEVRAMMTLAGKETPEKPRRTGTKG